MKTLHTMTIRDLKKFVDTLSDKQLDGELLYNSQEHSISGVVGKICIAKENLYHNGDDDPSPLYTKKELKKDLGLDSEEISELEIEVPKGSIVIEFP
jgi:hypothetical protein